MGSQSLCTFSLNTISSTVELVMYRPVIFHDHVKFLSRSLPGLGPFAGKRAWVCSTPGGAPGSSVIPRQPPRQKALGFRVALKRRAGCAHSQACARKLCHCLRAAACDFVSTSPATKLTHCLGKLSHFFVFWSCPDAWELSRSLAPPGAGAK